MAATQSMTTQASMPPGNSPPQSKPLTIFSFYPLILVIVFGAILYGITKRAFPKYWLHLTRARVRVALAILLPAQLVLVLPAIDRNLWHHIFTLNFLPDDIRDISLVLGSVGLLIWGQMVLFYADRNAHSSERVTQEMFDRMHRLASYTKGVTKAFLGVVGLKAERIAEFLICAEAADKKPTVDFATLRNLWNPPLQRKSLLAAIHEVTHAQVGVGYWVKVTYFEMEDNYLIPRQMFDGQHHNVATPPAAERECYNINATPARSLPAWIAKDCQTKIVTDIEKAVQDASHPQNWCPLKKLNAKSAAGFPLGGTPAQGVPCPAVIVIHTDKPGFFPDDKFTLAELELLADNVKERLHYEVNVDRLFTLFDAHKGAKQRGKRTKKASETSVSRNGQGGTDRGDGDGASSEGNRSSDHSNAPHLGRAAQK